MANYDFDLMVIGAGSGGISAANLGNQLGKKVALVEKEKIGGDCTWYGCVPSKALIKSSEIAHFVKTMEKYGLRANGNFELNTDNVMAHVRKIRENVYQEEKPEVFEKMGIKVFIGPPKFLDNHRVQIGNEVVSANKFIISTGSSPFVPPIEGIENVPYLTNENIFELEKLPDSMVVIGGGPIGTEMASALSRLGVKVTQVEMTDQILSREEPEMVKFLVDRMVADGVTFLTQSRATKLGKKGNKVIVTVVGNHDGESREVETDAVLIAVGRRPNVDGLNLENAGVEFDRKGIKTDATLRTTAKNIYACGDVIGSYQFSHIAEYHAGIAVPNAVLPLPVKRKVNYENIVWATFTDPEVAHAGLTESEAREKFGRKIKIYTFPYDRVDRAKTDLQTTGMSKFVVGKGGKLLGIHIVGERAAELLHEAQLAKSLKIPFHKIQKMIHIYPTYGDVVKRPSVQAFAARITENPVVKFVRKIAGK
ncbi:MAG: FAD-dependent oxidoreductase [Calditrichaeota bacterium]|nr:FAD-dependent oxidoreductase [Calditrichota bacterium]